MITLTPEERDKFAAWLEQEATSDDAMARQAETIGAGMVVAKHIRMKAAAKMFVAKELRLTESVEIG